MTWVTIRGNAVEFPDNPSDGSFSEHRNPFPPFLICSLNPDHKFPTRQDYTVGRNRNKMRHHLRGSAHRVYELRRISELLDKVVEDWPGGGTWM